MSGWLDSRTVLVTGGSGLIGSSVLRALSAERAVRTVSVSKAATEFSDRSYIADLRSDLPPIDEPIDAIIHLAAQSGGITDQTDTDILASNTSMTSNVLAFCRERSVDRMFLASSATVYATPYGRPRPITESDPTVGPSMPGATPYAWSKLSSEMLLLWEAASTDLTPVIGRFTQVYGAAPFGVDPHRTTAIHSLVMRAVTRKPEEPFLVWGSGRARRSYIHVDDAAAAIVHLLDLMDPPPLVNVSTDECHAMKEVAHIIMRHANIGDGMLRFDRSKPEGPAYRCVSPTLLATTGFEPDIQLDAGLKSVIEAYRHNL